VITELQELVAQKERFMSSISHEFRTPLNGIIGLSEALMSNLCGAVDDKVHHQLHIIRTSGLRLLALINDIMDAAALRRSQLFVKSEPVRVRTRGSVACAEVTAAHVFGCLPRCLAHCHASAERAGRLRCAT